MDHEGYKYERIDGGITGALRQEAIDRFNGEKFFHFPPPILESVGLPAKAGGHLFQKSVVVLHFCLSRWKAFVLKAARVQAGMRTKERSLEPFPSWQTQEIYVAAVADATYAGSEAGGCVSVCFTEDLGQLLATITEELCSHLGRSAGMKWRRI